MSDININGNGFDNLSKLLMNYQIEDNDVMKVLEDTAEELVKDVKKLPRPRSMITAAGYTHLLDTVSFRRKKSEIEVGWGKYYGPMLERGTRKMRASAHIKPTFQQNKERYYKNINKKLFGGG